MDSPELSRLKNKWLLLDTSVLIKISHLGDDIQGPLIALTEKYDCILTVQNLIIQEFLSYAIKQETYDARLKLIQQYPSLSITEKEREQAIHISRMYAVNKIKTPSVVDCLTAALIQQYRGKMFLLTNDLKDFPAPLFDVFYVWPRDDKGEVDLFGFLAFSSKKTAQQEEKLTRASR